MKFLLASLKTFTNSEEGFEKPHNISVPAFLTSHWWIFSGVHSWPAFRKFSGSQAALGQPEAAIGKLGGTSFLKRVTGKIFTISK